MTYGLYFHTKLGHEKTTFLHMSNSYQLPENPL